MKEILIVDDDVPIGNMLEEALQRVGYHVGRAYSGTEALMYLSIHQPHLILLDLMLPGISGEDLLPEMTGVPIIVMSAKLDMENKVSLLSGGAQDYVTKPFNIQELLARIAIQLRNRPTREVSTLAFADIVLNIDVCVVSVSSFDIKLTRTEFAILKLLMLNPTQVLSKSLILERIREHTPDCTESSLKIHMSHLRRKLREPSGKNYIEAVWGIGFKLVTPTFDTLTPA